MVIAYDGQPVEPHEPADGRIVLGPAMRIDLILDMAGKPGERFQIIDSFYRGLQYRLLDIVYDDPLLREQPLDRSGRACPPTRCPSRTPQCRTPRDRVQRRHDGRNDDARARHGRHGT